MYKDFKKSESLDTGFVGGSGIIWMFSGIILGLLVGLGMYYFTNNSSALSMASTVQNKIKQAQSAKPAGRDKTKRLYNKQSKNQHKGLEQDQSRKTKFSYYAVLPTLDVPVGAAKPIDTSLDILPNSKSTNIASVPETVAEVKQVEKNVKPTAPAVKDGNYLLQVASYKKKSRANVTRGRLAKNGIDAYIKSKKIKGRTWYRVVAGPVDQNSVDSWKHAAEKMGHRPLVISLR